MDIIAKSNSFIKDNWSILFSGIGISLLFGFLYKFHNRKSKRLWKDIIKYYKEIRTVYFQNSLLTINNSLFPNLHSEFDVEYNNQDNSNVPVQQYIYDSWNKEHRTHILLTAEVGMGKTVSLLKLYNEFIKDKKIIYILLHKISQIDGDSIGNFIKESVFNSNDILYCFF